MDAKSSETEVTARGVSTLVIRKRVTFNPPQDAQLNRVGLGYFSRALNEPQDVIAALREAQMPGAGQISLEGEILTLKKRRFAKGVGAEKKGKYYELRVPVKTPDDVYAVLRKHGLINDQILLVKDSSKLQEAIEQDRERIEKRLARRTKKGKNGGKKNGN